MVPSDAAAESMFTHHMHTAPWQLLTIYGILLFVTAGNLLKRLHYSGALADLCDGVKGSGKSIAEGLACSVLNAPARRCIGTDGR
jgi:hypothetical protein